MKDLDVRDILSWEIPGNLYAEDTRTLNGDVSCLGCHMGFVFAGHRIPKQETDCNA